MSARAAAVALVCLTAATAACSDDGGSVDAFCSTARRFTTDNPATVFDRYDPGDPASAVTLLREAGDRIRSWAREAPSEVDDDVALIAQAADDLATTFESPDPAELPADRRNELEARFTAVEAASTRVTSYVRDQCAVELDPAGVPVTQAQETPSTPTTAP